MLAIACVEMTGNITCTGCDLPVPVFPVRFALEMNRKNPSEGLERHLLGIRADLGPNAAVALCGACQTVEGLTVVPVSLSNSALRESIR